MNFSGAENVPLLGLFWYISCTGSGTEKQIPKNGTMMYRNSPRLGTINQKGKDRHSLHLCTNMRPRLTHIWAETGTENGSLLKEKGMTSCAESYGAVKGLCTELSCKHCLQILQITSRLHVVTDPYGL